ncbi:cobalt ABC transporter, inner membrane subunit CbiQ [Thalassoporum mexicanum PCC 7367]|uniref:cobalt ECF transporter T component CbiQ n=1 Tax=Thalassoporum mexicanum TaxID=3457544 RepID=UPI00029FB30B|nr:cobalt ECF transporter T component CbiQ [Pseudanabaena sp. PCC 7367]AFY70862.1 cobalt ABC transporter, inner membrane subunit CbiQ [Pseudanabaena sp. PCC 7367]
MQHGLDQHAKLNSPIHRWDCRYKLIGLMALIFAFASLEDWRLILIMLAIAILCYGLSRLPVAYWCDRLKYPGLFMLGVVALVPFLSGETVLWQWGGLSLYLEGCIAVLIIICRFLAIMTITLVLFGTSTFLTTIRAMRSLGLSRILTDMLLLSYRYLHEISADLNKMQTAMRLRGFNGRKLNWRTLGLLASLLGTMLIRSHERSERVYRAMQLRGYGSEQQLNRHDFGNPRSIRKTWLGGDAIALYLTIAAAISLGITQYQLGTNGLLGGLLGG